MAGALGAKLFSTALIALNRLCRDNSGKKKCSHWKQTTYPDRPDSGVAFSKCQVLLWPLSSFRAIQGKAGFVRWEQYVFLSHMALTLCKLALGSVLKDRESVKQVLVMVSLQENNFNLISPQK